MIKCQENNSEVLNNPKITMSKKFKKSKLHQRVKNRLINIRAKNHCITSFQTQRQHTLLKPDAYLLPNCKKNAFSHRVRCATRKTTKNSQKTRPSIQGVDFHMSQNHEKGAGITYTTEAS